MQMFRKFDTNTYILNNTFIHVEAVEKGNLVYVVSISPCSYSDETVWSTKNFHSKLLADLAKSRGVSVEKLVSWFLSDSVDIRALAWQTVADSFGWAWLDPSPRLLETFIDEYRFLKSLGI